MSVGCSSKHQTLIEPQFGSSNYKCQFIIKNKWGVFSLKNVTFAFITPDFLSVYKVMLATFLDIIETDRGPQEVNFEN